MKQWRTIIIFASALVVLVVLLIVGSKMNKTDGTSSTATPTPALDPVVEVDEKDVSGIRIENANGVVELKASKVIASSSSSASGSGLAGSAASSSASAAETIEWSLVKPSGVAYSASALKLKTDYLLKITASAEISTEGGDPAEYGLDEPSATITITKTSGEAVTVLYGDKTVGDSGYYVMVEGSPRICMTSSYIGDAAMIGVLDLIDNSIFGTLASADLTRLDFTRKKDSLAIQAVSNLDADAAQGTEATWKITSPVAVAASTENFPNFLKELLALSPSEYVELHPKDLGKYGLDDPDYKAVLITADGQSVILIGGDAGGGAKYGYTDHTDAVFVISASAFSYIDMPAVDLIDTFVSMTSIWDVSKLDLKIGDLTIACGIKDSQDKSEESDFTVNGKDANVVNKDEDSYFRNFYQTIVGIFIAGLDPAAKPAYSEDIVIQYTMKADGSVLKFTYAPRDAQTYYVFRNGIYLGFYVNKAEFYSEVSGNEGVLTSYQALAKAIENQVDGVYD